jgi:hypothetical protein
LDGRKDPPLNRLAIEGCIAAHLSENPADYKGAFFSTGHNWTEVSPIEDTIVAESVALVRLRLQLGKNLHGYLLCNKNSYSGYQQHLLRLPGSDISVD